MPGVTVVRAINRTSEIDRLVVIVAAQMAAFAQHSMSKPNWDTFHDLGGRFTNEGVRLVSAVARELERQAPDAFLAVSTGAYRPIRLPGVEEPTLAYWLSLEDATLGRKHFSLVAEALAGVDGGQLAWRVSCHIRFMMVLQDIFDPGEE